MPTSFATAPGTHSVPGPSIGTTQYAERRGSGSVTSVAGTPRRESDPRHSAPAVCPYRAVLAGVKA